MNKSRSIVIAVVGTFSFLVSAIRPQLVGEGARYLRWHHDWR